MMRFFAACSKCLRGWITFRGRASRAEYWYFHLGYVLFIAALVLGAVGIVSFGRMSGGLMETSAASRIGMLVLAAVFLFLMIASVSVTVRRLHDRNMSGWWYAAYLLLSIVQSAFAELGQTVASDTAGLIGTGLALAILLATVAGFVLMVIPGTQGTNRYGPDPRRDVDLTVFA